MLAVTPDSNFYATIAWISQNNFVDLVASNNGT